MELPRRTKLSYYSALRGNYITHWRDIGYLVLVTRSGWQLYINVLMKTNGSLDNTYLFLKTIASSFITWGSWEKINDRVSS